MILPSQLHIDWSFTAVAIWTWEPVANDDAADRPSGTADTADAASPMPGTAPCGDPEPPTLRLVFKGYEWRPTALWECLANPDWDHWADSGRDHSIEQARRDERNRQAGVPKPPLPPVGPVPGRDPGS
jgi:hypothetical protein